MKTHKVPNMVKCHFWRGTSNMVSIHTPAKIYVGDIINFGGTKVKVTEMRNPQTSQYYSNHNYYEIKFDANAVKN